MSKNYFCEQMQPKGFRFFCIYAYKKPEKNKKNTELKRIISEKLRKNQKNLKEKMRKN